MNLTIRANNVGEQVYRKELRDKVNATAIKQFISDRAAFVKEFIYGEPRIYKETASTVMGSLVHVMILQSEKFEELYTITQMVPPSGQILELIQEMYSIDCRTRDNEGKQTVQFEQVFMDAVQEVKFRGGIEELAFKKKTPEMILGLLTKPDKETGIAPEQYYKELLVNHGKTVVTMYQITKAEQIVQEMKANEWINKWINAVDTDNIHVYNEHVVEFEYGELKCRALIDRFIVDHSAKTIEVVDIKSTWDSKGVSYTYTNNMWYCQGAMYEMALQQFIVDNKLEGYKLENMRFLICDTTGFYRSCSYQMTDDDTIKARIGFTVKSGKRYTGTIEALNEMLWCQSIGKWNESQEQAEKQGQMQFQVPYQ